MQSNSRDAYSNDIHQIKDMQSALMRGNFAELSVLIEPYLQQLNRMMICLLNAPLEAPQAAHELNGMRRAELEQLIHLTLQRLLDFDGSTLTPEGAYCCSVRRSLQNILLRLSYVNVCPVGRYLRHGQFVPFDISDDADGSTVTGYYIELTEQLDTFLRRTVCDIVGERTHYERRSVAQKRSVRNTFSFEASKCIQKTTIEFLAGELIRLQTHYPIESEAVVHGRAVLKMAGDALADLEASRLDPTIRPKRLPSTAPQLLRSVDCVRFRMTEFSELHWNGESDLDRYMESAHSVFAAMDAAILDCYNNPIVRYTNYIILSDIFSELNIIHRDVQVLYENRETTEIECAYLNLFRSTLYCLAKKMELVSFEQLHPLLLPMYFPSETINQETANRHATALQTFHKALREMYFKHCLDLQEEPCGAVYYPYVRQVYLDLFTIFKREGELFYAHGLLRDEKEFLSNICQTIEMLLDKLPKPVLKQEQAVCHSAVPKYPPGLSVPYQAEAAAGADTSADPDMDLLLKLTSNPWSTGGMVPADIPCPSFEMPKDVLRQFDKIWGAPPVIFQRPGSGSLKLDKEQQEHLSASSVKLG